MTFPAHRRPIHRIRWLNFRRLLAADPGLTITSVALRMDKPQGQVSHFGGKRPSKVMGDQIAEEIEAAFALEAGWLDVDRGEDEALSDGRIILTSQSPLASRNLRTDPAILAEAVKLVEIDEALGGRYDHLKHASLLLDLYDRVEAGEDPRELQARLAYQRVVQGSQEDGVGSKARGGAAA